jgi:hypothetical protein
MHCYRHNFQGYYEFNKSSDLISINTIDQLLPGRNKKLTNKIKSSRTNYSSKLYLGLLTLINFIFFSDGCFLFFLDRCEERPENKFIPILQTTPI